MSFLETLKSKFNNTSIVLTILLSLIGILVGTGVGIIPSKEVQTSKDIIVKELRESTAVTHVKVTDITEPTKVSTEATVEVVLKLEKKINVNNKRTDELIAKKNKAIEEILNVKPEDPVAVADPIINTYAIEQKIASVEINAIWEAYCDFNTNNQCNKGVAS